MPSESTPLSYATINNKLHRMRDAAIREQATIMLIAMGYDDAEAEQYVKDANTYDLLSIVAEYRDVASTYPQHMREAVDA